MVRKEMPMPRPKGSLTSEQARAVRAQRTTEITSEQARAMSEARDTHKGGRPRKKGVKRCRCGLMTAKRAAARCHKC